MYYRNAQVNTGFCHKTASTLSAVEPLLKDTPNKGHLEALYKGQALCSLQDHCNTILPLKEDHLSITVKLVVPKCPLFGSFTASTILIDHWYVNGLISTV